MSVLAGNPGPGPFLLARRCIWIYSLEYVIKTVNAAPWGARHHSSEEARQARTYVLNTLNRWFMKLVSPRSFDDIVQRYHRDIASIGKAVPDLWKHAAHSLPTGRLTP